MINFNSKQFDIETIKYKIDFYGSPIFSKEILECPHILFCLYIYQNI